MDAVPILSGSTSSSLVGDNVWQMSNYSVMNCDAFRTPSVDDTALLMCHESSPIDEVVVCTTSESYQSSSAAAVDAECDSSVPISLAAALLETSSLIRRSFVHRVMLNDRRVLKAMLSLDDQCLPSAHYFKYTQPDLLPFMRRMVVTWMLEVCEEQQCEEEVFPLSVNYLDRVLSVMQVKRTQLQLLATVCMFIASKFKDMTPLSAQSLVIYTDNSIDMGDLLDWELIVLQALRWDISAVTPHDFLEYIVARLPLDADERQAVRRHAKTFIVLCTSDFKFVVCPPSMVAAACVSAAATGLLGDSRCRHVELIEHLRDVTSIDPECLRQCQEQIEESLRASVSETTSSASGSVMDSSNNKQSAVDQTGKTALPTTPTDVREISIVDN